jgi:hypothetical protein
MQRSLEFTKDEFYHVYNRGVDKRKIFFTENDKRHFLEPFIFDEFIRS